MNTSLYDTEFNIVFDKIIPKIKEGTKIPQIIHQTFASKNLPEELQKNIKKLKRFNPGWTYNLYDDTDIEIFIWENYGKEVLHYYHRINPHYGAAKADLFRYLLMYKCGGVYLDVKSTCNCALDQVLKVNDRFILSKWRNKPGEIHATWGTAIEVKHIDGGEYQQWHILAAPGHPFLRAVLRTVLNNINNYRPWIHGIGGMGVLRLTGPIAYTLSIQPLLLNAEYRMIENETVIGLQYSIYKPLEHRNIYKKNYAIVTEPIVQVNIFSKIIFYLYDVAKRTKRLLFN